MSDQAGKVIKPPNTLSQKVTVGGPGAVDAAALERAETVISDLAGDYVNWAKDDIKRLEGVFAGMKDGSGDNDKLAQEVFQFPTASKARAAALIIP